MIELIKLTATMHRAQIVPNHQISGRIGDRENVLRPGREFSELTQQCFASFARHAGDVAGMPRKVKRFASRPSMYMDAGMLPVTAFIAFLVRQREAALLARPPKRVSSPKTFEPGFQARAQILIRS